VRVSRDTVHLSAIEWPQKGRCRRFAGACAIIFGCPILLRRPFRAGKLLLQLPRALPWATLHWPFRPEEMGGKKDRRCLQKGAWPLIFSDLFGQGNRRIRALTPKDASYNGIQWLPDLFSSILFLRALRGLRGKKCKTISRTRDFGTQRACGRPGRALRQPGRLTHFGAPARPHPLSRAEVYSGHLVSANAVTEMTARASATLVPGTRSLSIQASPPMKSHNFWKSRMAIRCESPATPPPVAGSPSGGLL